MLTLLAPAKINTYLHITGKRADGYHLLDTVFQRVNLFDTIRLAARDDGQLILHTPMLGVPDAQHLAVKAALVLKNHMLKKHASKVYGADIWVEKNIPSGAGLGGGSSDAASTLIGLNQLWGCGLDALELQHLGLQLGADVPFFCSQFSTAKAQGIGEQLQAINTPSAAYLLVYPHCHVPTPSVFKHPDLNWQQAENDRRKAPWFSSPNVESELSKINYFSNQFGNDLQSVAQTIAPPIEQAVRLLQSIPNQRCVRMTGSGSAVFAVFDHIAQATEALDWFNRHRPAQGQDWLAWAVSGVTASCSLKNHDSLRSSLNEI